VLRILEALGIPALFLLVLARYLRLVQGRLEPGVKQQTDHEGR
jgi:hypothetical protein